MNEESNNIKEDMSSRWLRGAFVVFFLLTMRVTTQLITIVAVFQFLHTLFVARANLKAMSFGRSLGLYLNETAQFASYNVETKPWPFTDWPSASTQSEIAEKHDD